MNKQVLLILIVLSQGVCAQMSVEKILLDSQVVIGGAAKIALNITNPYVQPVTVKIKDKSVLGGNGIDIQCFEASIPQGSQLIRYEDITPYAEGEFTLEAAEISYPNPQTGKEETVKSNTLEVKVEKSKNQTQAQRQGITTVYRCGNVNMQSTSYSSQGGSTSFQLNFGGSLNQEMDDLMNQMQPKSMQERLQEMQQRMSQDTQALRQQMQNQMAQQKQTEQGFQESVQQNPKFREMQEILSQQGYEQAGKRLTPESNKTGDFEYSYKKGNDTAAIMGRMQDGEIEDMTQWGSEQQRQLKQALTANPEFQKLDQQLQKEGYQPKQIQIEIPNQNRSKFNIQYEKDKKQANVTGAININGTVEEIRLEKEEEKQNIPWLVIPLVIALLAIAYCLWKKKKPKNTYVKEKEVEENIDYRANAKQMLAEAQKLFDNKQEENAYMKVSGAVRYFFKHELNHMEDFTDDELIKYLDKKKHQKTKDVKKCLNLCSLVKFAKYKTNKKEFMEIFDNAEKVI